MQALLFREVVAAVPQFHNFGVHMKSVVGQRPRALCKHLANRNESIILSSLSTSISLLFSLSSLIRRSGPKFERFCMVTRCKVHIFMFKVRTDYKVNLFKFKTLKFHQTIYYLKIKC